jgi:hypothetical protein
MEQQTVDVKVGKILKEYILSTNGSDVLVVEKASVLWGLILQHLVGIRDLFNQDGADYVPIRAEECAEYIKITILDSSHWKTYSVEEKKCLKIHTDVRCFLSRRGQNIVRRFLYKEFRKTFIDYMRGALNNNCDLQQKEAIYEFCTDHDLSLDNITLDALQKSWYRWKKKHGLLDKVCSINY